MPEIAAIAVDCRGFTPFRARSGRCTELWSPPSVHRWPRRRWQRPGAWHRGAGLDASPIVARLGVARRWVGLGLLFGCPDSKGAEHARDHLPRAAGRHLRDGDQPSDRDRRRLDVRRSTRVRRREAMGREFAEDLRLLEDLGWAEHIDRETVALTQPPDELTSTLARLHRDASGVAGHLRLAAEGRGGARPARPRGLRGARRDPQPARPARRRRRGGDLVTAAKPTSEEAVAKALASGDELTGAEIATATGLGRSTVGKALAATRARRHCLAAIPAGVTGVAGCRTAGRSGRATSRRYRPPRPSGCVPASSMGSSSSYINSQGHRPWARPRSPRRSGARPARWATA